VLSGVVGSVCKEVPVVRVGVLAAAVCALALWPGCRSADDTSDDFATDAEREILAADGGLIPRSTVAKSPAAETPKPMSASPEEPPERLRLTLDGRGVARTRGEKHWRVAEPVSSEPAATFKTTLDPVRKATIYLYECNAQGDLAGDTAVSIIDPSGRTLTPGKEFNLAAPEGCLMWQDRILKRVVLKPGRYYCMRLRVESDGDSETLSVVFRVR
jgi:hypothetical protein